MRLFLDNFINTLTRRRREHVASLLDEARVGKQQLDVLVQRLNEADFRFNPLILSKEAPSTLISAEVPQMNFNLITNRIEEMFDISNRIALLLNSHATVLNTDILSIENELIAMEKMVENFAFLLSDNQAYDYAYLESFTDENGRDININHVPDRSALSFGSFDSASIRTDEGILTLPDTPVVTHGLTGRILKGNSTAFTVYDSGLNNALVSGTSKGWRMTVASGGVIDAPLPEAPGIAGAQVVLEFELTDAAPCSEIKLLPYSDISLDVVQVTTYKTDDDSEGRNHLGSPIRFSKPLTIHFPMESVLRFRVVLNQATYHRVTRNENVREYRYNHLIKSVNERQQTGDPYGRTYFIKDFEQSILTDALGRGHLSISLPSTALEATHGPMDISNLTLAIRYDNPYLWREEGSDSNSYIMFDLMHQIGGDLVAIKRKGGEFDFAQNAHLLNTDDPAVALNEDTFIEQIVGAGFNYYYNIGLFYVSIGVESPGFKGVFVSKPLSSPGDIGEVRIKTKEENYEMPFTARHSSKLTSVEYSVSNQSNPENEIDWLPILPVGTTEVLGERMFLDKEGRAYFRFPVQESSIFSVFRNGFTIPLDQESFILENTSGDIAGIKIDPELINPEDIYTCNYTPVGNPTVVSFEYHGFDLPPLVFAHDETGAGERFLSTGSRNTINLLNKPFIDPNLSALGGYQPIVIRLSDGSVAQNVTNYQTGKNPSFPPVESGVFYIQSGDVIMFNQQILSPFRVFYQYLENNVRFRVVLRCNHQDFVSPKVDFVHLKAKTRESDVRPI